ncbi:hypothetical protein E4U42_000729 [Claviceps africana]|uniref:Uncharacterized protein n=1 Tax=Claviceps africana TaxID=83212 RepID=A0A8K0J011_9HYPO|nr:hypothetical protein E4U42_000729 [Claviceps africana]
MPDHEAGIHGTTLASGSDDAGLHGVRSAARVPVSPELLEKLHLASRTDAGHVRKTFANPTPIPMAGFVLSLTPLSMHLMGWRGVGGSGAAGIPVYYFQGGLLMVVGALLEWILGNTFPAVVFSVFGSFWLAYAGILNANANAAAPLAQSTSTDDFNTTVACWFLFMGVLCFLFLICSLRTNVVFFAIFLSLVLAFALLTGAFLLKAEAGPANAARVDRLLVGAGATSFVTALGGWYILLALLLAAVDFPLRIPVGDLSTVVKGKSDAQKNETVPSGGRT